MPRRQTVPEQWLIISGANDSLGIAAVRRLPRGTGILLLKPLRANDARHLLHIARMRGLTVVRESPRMAARVHNARELRTALLARTQHVFLSPLHRTATHRDWKPIGRMRAAALARLGARGLFALGGMDKERYARIAALGFRGWAAIGSWRRLATNTGAPIVRT